VLWEFIRKSVLKNADLLAGRRGTMKYLP